MARSTTDEHTDVVDSRGKSFCTRSTSEESIEGIIGRSSLSDSRSSIIASEACTDPIGGLPTPIRGSMITGRQSTRTTGP
jgi:hypothetical protein